MILVGEVNRLDCSSDKRRQLYKAACDMIYLFTAINWLNCKWHKLNIYNSIFCFTLIFLTSCDHRVEVNCTKSSSLFAFLNSIRLKRNAALEKILLNCVHVHFLFKHMTYGMYAARYLTYNIVIGNGELPLIVIT